MSSRKPQKAVHSTDPGQSGWWLLAPACGTVVGAAIPHLGTLGSKRTKETTEERVHGFAHLKSSFRNEPRHMRVWK